MTKTQTEVIAIPKDLVEMDLPTSRMDKLIGVRLHSELIDKLDKARGGMTRPAKIREILEKEL